MKNIWIVLCQSASVDADTNQINLFNCLEGLKLKLKPGVAKPEADSIPIECQLVSMWTKELGNTDEENVDVKMEFIDPNNKVLHSADASFTSEKGKVRHRHRLFIKGLPITDGGRYYFKTLLKDGEKYREIARTPLDIEITQ